MIAYLYLSVSQSHVEVVSESRSDYMVPPREKEGEIVPEEYFPGEEVRFKGCNLGKAIALPWQQDSLHMACMNSSHMKSSGLLLSPIKYKY